MLSFAKLPLSVTSLVLFFLISLPTSDASHTTSSGISIPIVSRSRLAKRAGVKATHNGTTVVTNSYDTVYMCNITLNGAEFEVLIDTGSSDLWVAGEVPGANNLSIPAKVTYAKGSAQGFINTATLEFDQFTIPDQAFIDVVPSADNPVEQGVLGLGPSSASNVRSRVKSSKGDTPLDRIFKQNTTTPNFLTVALSRTADDGAFGADSFSANGVEVPQLGQLTIGRLVPGLEAITKQPKLPALEDKFGIQHWQAALDANGILGPDGVPIPVNTTIPGTITSELSRLHAIFDTGFTFPQVPRAVADAVYGRVPGAVFVAGEERDKGGSPGYWRVPCDYEFSMTFVFGGVAVPIAPLDMTMVEKRDRNGLPITCMATFREIAPDVADHTKFGAFDLILGMAFLRNTYLLIDFGDFVDGQDGKTADPYIQLLPVTNMTDAHHDFVTVRLSGEDRTDTQQELLPFGQGEKSPEPDPNSPFFRDNRLGTSTDEGTPWYRSVYFIVGASIAGFLAMVALGVLAARMFTRRKSNVKKEAAFVPAMSGVRAYRPLAVAGSAPVAGDAEKGFVVSAVGTRRPDSPVWDDKYDPEPDPYELYNPYQHSRDRTHGHEYPNPYTDSHMTHSSRASSGFHLDSAGYDYVPYENTELQPHTGTRTESHVRLVTQSGPGAGGYSEPRSQLYGGNAPTAGRS